MLYSPCSSILFCKFIIIGYRVVVSRTYSVVVGCVYIT